MFDMSGSTAGPSKSGSMYQIVKKSLEEIWENEAECWKRFQSAEIQLRIRQALTALRFTRYALRLSAGDTNTNEGFKPC